MDWDDLRYYLAVARHGSIRAASNHLSVNPSTVSRRIDSYEKKIGVRLFERLPSGYTLTKAGLDMIQSAELIENEVASLGRRVTGQDSQLDGNLRVTLPAPFATHLLMQDIAEFQLTYPKINLELQISYDVLNLSKREADIAIRITSTPEEYLIGKKVGKLAFSTYASVDYLSNNNLYSSAQWIQHSCDKNFLEWKNKGKFSNAPIRHIIDDPFVIFHSVKAGLGIAKLACFMADKDDSIQKIDEVEEEKMDIWLLMHKDLRSTARVKVFIDFMSKAFEKHREILSGKKPAKKSTTWHSQSHIA